MEKLGYQVAKILGTIFVVKILADMVLAGVDGNLIAAVAGVFMLALNIIGNGKD